METTLWHMERQSTTKLAESEQMAAKLTNNVENGLCLDNVEIAEDN